MIFVVGASCAGKTHAVARLLELEPSFSRVSASAVLQELERPLRPLTPHQALENQIVLAEALRSRGLVARNLILLDGHATVETTEGPLPVPDAWYDAMAFEAMVLVEADPSDIATRRSRRGLPWSEGEAFVNQEFERDHAVAQARRKAIPLIEAGPTNADELPGRIFKALSSGRDAGACR